MLKVTACYAGNKSTSLQKKFALYRWWSSVLAAKLHHNSLIANITGKDQRIVELEVRKKVFAFYLFRLYILIRHFQNPCGQDGACGCNFDFGGTALAHSSAHEAACEVNESQKCRSSNWRSRRNGGPRYGFCHPPPVQGGFSSSCCCCSDGHGAGRRLRSLVTA